AEEFNGLLMPLLPFVVLFGNLIMVLLSNELTLSTFLDLRVLLPDLFIWSHFSKLEFLEEAALTGFLRLKKITGTSFWL
ncbi:hypothetical protein L9G15_25990, partial [Shewanella sp. A3A]|nr:hypothetical protein [Shewanella ferrihydritica]